MFSQLARTIVKRAVQLLPSQHSPNPSTCAAALRMFADRAGCSEEKPPRCSSENLTKSPCMASRKKGDPKQAERPPPVVPMWENPECCLELCKDALPRFDDLYYKPSDKAKRIYQQTWIECPERRIVKKIVCDYDKLMFPLPERRPRKTRVETACSFKNPDCELMNCLKISGNKLCVKITLPGCRPLRANTSCKRARYKMDCKKVCCPYPSFSECSKPKPKPRRPVECNCLSMPSMCDIYYLAKKNLIRLPKPRH